MCKTQALLLSMENNENDFSRILVLTSVPIVLIIGSTVVCNESIYHFNHQFSLLYNLKHKKSSSLKEGKNYEDMVLELHAYYTHNFGAISLAGCGALTLPSKPGKYDIEVPTWKPISCSNMGEIRGRMQHYYLGSCLEEIRPSDPVPTSERESDWVKGTNVKLLSKGGLQTDGSGSIMVRVDVMENYFNKRKGADMTVSEEEESYQHRVRMRETVDEVLARVRQNKRERMVRVRDSVNDANSKGITKSVGWRREENTPSTEGTGASNNCGSEILAGRTAEVLERVKSRNSSSNTGQDAHP